MKNLLRSLLLQEDLNFLLTNRVPRIALTRFMGWFSKIRNPVVCRLSIATWKLFTDLDLSDARKRRFDSLHDCFTRELVPGARPVDPDPGVLTSPCDAIVGACGSAAGTEVFQAKGFPYRMEELFGPSNDVAPYRDGTYVTLRLTSAMYHRFHAPQDLAVEHVTYHSGDAWNVNPIALKRVERLFCRNERAVLRTRLARGGHPVAIVPVAAILVASLRLKFLDVLLHLRYKGPNEISLAGHPARFAKGEEMGWFQHGSTIIVFAPRGFELHESIVPGARLRMGQPLMRLPAMAAAPPRATAGEAVLAG
ncbi:MAG TPA: archaetidylserine decarboxylase [Burkholderiaceae bacterium]